MSIRLMDNTQFRFGESLRPVASSFGSLMETLKKSYLTCVYGFRLDSICVMTLLFEGDCFYINFLLYCNILFCY